MRPAHMAISEAWLCMAMFCSLHLSCRDICQFVTVSSSLSVLHTVSSSHCQFVTLPVHHSVSLSLLVHHSVSSSLSLHHSISSSYCQFATVSSSLIQCTQLMYATLVKRPCSFSFLFLLPSKKKLLYKSVRRLQCWCKRPFTILLIISVALGNI